MSSWRHTSRAEPISASFLAPTCARGRFSSWRFVIVSAVLPAAKRGTRRQAHGAGRLDSRLLAIAVMASTWLGSGSGGWGFGRRVVDPDQARREAEAIAIAPDPWPEFAGPVVYVGSSECEVVPNLSEFSIEVHLEPTSEPLSVFYEFRTEAEEGFGMSGAGVKGNMGFRVDLVNVIREELMVLLEPRVYQSHLQVPAILCYK